MLIPLCETKVGTVGTIQNVLCTPLALRLSELGFIAGSAVKTIIKKDNGSCAVYLIKGTLIALRHDVARNINVSL